MPDLTRGPHNMRPNRELGKPAEQPHDEEVEPEKPDEAKGRGTALGVQSTTRTR